MNFHLHCKKQFGRKYLLLKHGLNIVCVITFFLFFLKSKNINAQVIKAAANLGFNATQVDGDEVYGYHKFGLNTGLQAIIPVKKPFFISIETGYTQKGSYQRPQLDDSLSGEYKLKLDYVEVPVLFHYVDKDRVQFGTGFSYGRLFSVYEEEHGREVPWTPTTQPYKKSDVDWIFNFNFPIYQNLHFDFRYQYSVARIRTRYFPKTQRTRYQFHNMLTFRLSYVINESKGKKRKSKNVE